MRTIKELQQDIKNLNNYVNSVTKIKDVTEVSEETAHHINALDIKPKFDYSMGSVVSLAINGNVFKTYDHTKEYARGCKYSARHGKVIIDFPSKAMFKKFSKLVVQGYKAAKRVQNLNQNHGNDPNYSTAIKIAHDSYMDCANQLEDMATKYADGEFAKPKHKTIDVSIYTKW